MSYLAEDIARRQRSELAAQAAELRRFQEMGLDYGAVQQARAEAATQATLAAAAARREPQGQLLIPGLGKQVTLMELRGPGPMTPAQEAALGVVGPVGWQRAPVPVGQQLELDFRGMAPGVNGIVGFSRPAEQRVAAGGPDRFAGDRLARALLLSAAGAAGGVGALWELADEDGSQF